MGPLSSCLKRPAPPYRSLKSRQTKRTKTTQQLRWVGFVYYACTFHQRTCVDDRYERPAAARFPWDSYTSSRCVASSYISSRCAASSYISSRCVASSYTSSRCVASSYTSSRCVARTGERRCRRWPAWFRIYSSANQRRVPWDAPVRSDTPGPTTATDFVPGLVRLHTWNPFAI